MRIAISTDTHFNLVKTKKIDNFCNSIVEKNVDALFITGDISESDLLHAHLGYVYEKINKPIYFVLGNHDYYKSSIGKTNKNLSDFIKKNYKDKLIWLTETGIIKLSKKTCLIGGENWWDGGYGDIKKQGILQELIMLQDYRIIEDLVVKKEKRLNKLKDLTKKCMEHFEKVLPEALEKYDNVILLTHVPPFKESCSHQLFPFKDEWLFHFCCRSLGEYLESIMIRNPNKNLTVFCGHTHESTIYKPQPNLTVMVGSSSYFKPKVFTTITIE